MIELWGSEERVDPATMSGFLKNEAHRAGADKASIVMRSFNKTTLPVLLITSKRNSPRSCILWLRNTLSLIVIFRVYLALLSPIACTSSLELLMVLALMKPRFVLDVLGC
jgi:hypothetical protein